MNIGNFSTNKALKKNRPAEPFPPLGESGKIVMRCAENLYALRFSSLRLTQKVALQGGAIHPASLRQISHNTLLSTSLRHK